MVPFQTWNCLIKAYFYQLQLSCCCFCFFVKPPTCSRTENHLWRGTHRSERSSGLLFCSLGCTARAWTELQSSPRRPAHLPSPKRTINWAARRQSGTECSLLTSTSCRCVFVATSELSEGRGELLLTEGTLLPWARTVRDFCFLVRTKKHLFQNEWPKTWL